MKKLNILFILLCSTFWSIAQLEQVVVQTYAVHDGVVGTTDLTGYTTYRVYAELTDPTDYCSSVFAINECHPLSIRTVGGDFFNSPFGGTLGTEINGALVTVFPELEYDSFVTIGSDMMGAFDNEAVQSVFTFSPDPLADPFGNAAGGGDFNAIDGAWFSFTSSDNGYPTGENNSVLLFQVTTNGDLEFEINVQIFDEGDGIGGRMDYVSSGNIGCGFEGEVDGSNMGLIYANSLCNDPTACNYNDSVEEGQEDNSTCEYDSCAGCTDDTACNYDDNATIDDGTCTTMCPGCMDEAACNYDENATVDEGCDYLSCAGCTDENACNYDATATIDDGSCSEPDGCTVPFACNYDEEATCDNGTCEFESCAGCTNENADNYDETATIDDGSCEIPGCTDGLAFNFNWLATYDDGSCNYDCDEEIIIVETTDSFGDGWNEAAYEIYDSEGNLVASGDLDTAPSGDGTSWGAQSFCLPIGTYTIETIPGAFPLEVFWEIECTGGETVMGNGESETITFEISDGDCIPGCMNPDAENYDPEATYESGNCIVNGCTNTAADNYDSDATDDDGSCEYNIDGYVFYDANFSGVFDSEFDFALPLFEVTLEPGGMSVFTDSEGYYNFGTVEEGEYTLSVTPTEAYDINTTENPVEFNTTELEENNDFDFGLSNGEYIYNVNISNFSFGMGYPCNSNPAWHWVYVTNTGFYADITVTVEYDELFEGHEEVIGEIASVDGNTVTYEFEDVAPGETKWIILSLITPSFEFMGEFLTVTTQAYAYDSEDEFVAFGEHVTEGEVTCAYDPNDKQVFPNGYEEPHYVLNDTELEYLVRFQNVGNAAATDVLVVDTLDANLDLETFHLLGSSHNMMTCLDPVTREIQFIFDGIMLPDSGANEPESHGFLSYAISPYPELASETVIENTAHIFFDSNPAVVTNTTWNTIFDCFGLAEFNVLEGVLCEDELFQASTDQPYIENFEWSTEDNELPNESLVEFSFGESGTYDVTLMAENPLCSETFTTSVTVNPLPTAEFTDAGAELTATSASSYQWYLNGEEIEGATEMTYTAVENGNYSVEVTNEFGCSSISDELFVSVIGVDEQSENMAVLYPNPMINSSILQLNKIGDYQVDIYNANGQRVSSLTIMGTNQLTINRNDLAAGVYYIQIVQGNSILSQLPLLVE